MRRVIATFDAFSLLMRPKDPQIQAKELYVELANVLEKSIQRKRMNKGVGKCYWMDGA